MKIFKTKATPRHLTIAIDKTKQPEKHPSSTHILKLKIEFSWMHPYKFRFCVLYRDSLGNLFLAQQKVKIFRHAAAQLSLMHFFIAETWIAVATCKLQCLKMTGKLSQISWNWNYFDYASLVSMFMKTKHENAFSLSFRFDF